MNKPILAAALLSIGLLCSACESEAEHRAKWIATCAQNDFTEKQCGVLYSLAKGSSDAKDAAAIAAMNSGIAIGLSAGRR